MFNYLKFLRFYLVGVVLLLSSPAGAKLKSQPGSQTANLPQLTDLNSEQGTASASMTCTGTPPYNSIRCQVTLVTVQKRNQTQIQEEVRQVKRFFEALDSKGFQREKKRLCNEYQLSLGDSSSRQLASHSKFHRDSHTLLQRACASPSKDDLKMTLLKRKRMEGSVCFAKSKTFSLDFSKSSPTTFMSNPGPEGPCKVITVSVLERDLSKADLWKFSQTVISANTDGSCEKLALNRPTTYSAKNSQTLGVECKYMRFGASE